MESINNMRLCECKSKLKDEVKPHPNLQNAKIIKWIRDRSPSKKITNSLNVYYENSTDKVRTIKPKYIFSDSNLKKIDELKYLFRQFDNDNSKTLEFKEIEEMFKSNNIPMDIETLKNIFLRNKKEEEKNSQKHLDFNTLVNSAISKNTDDFYRASVRKIKSNMTEIQKDKIYIPMNFNRLFDHFSQKSQINEKKNEINKTIKRMKLVRNIKNDSNRLIQEETKANKLQTISLVKTIEQFEDIIGISANILTSKNKKKDITQSFANQFKANIPDKQSVKKRNNSNLYDDKINFSGLPLIDTTRISSIDRSPTKLSNVSSFNIQNSYMSRESKNSSMNFQPTNVIKNLKFSRVKDGC